MQNRMKTSAWLLEFKSNAYSQTGEDGVIAKILEVLPQSDKWCVEFGAWDGLHLSNVRNLIQHNNFSAVLIEADRAKFRQLQRNYLQNLRVIAINRLVGWYGENSLDQILQETPLAVDFDFLSIDVDGNDYHVWKALENYGPKVVCVEFNPTIPTAINFVQPADASVNQGASLLSLVKLGRQKGYELVAVLDFNAFFVKAEYYPLFQVEDNRPEVLRTNLGMTTQLFVGYDGRVFLHGYKKLPWHGIALKEDRIQPLPRFLRKYPCNYNRIERLAYLVYESLARRLND